jgi:hypothetical protein
MANQWEEFFQEIVDGTGELIKDEVKEMLDSARNDSDEFLQRQAEKIVKYLNQLAMGKINKRQIEGYLMDIKALTEMHVLQLSVAARARAQRLTRGISELIVKRLLAFI